MHQHSPCDDERVAHPATQIQSRCPRCAYDLTGHTEGWLETGARAFSHDGRDTRPTDPRSSDICPLGSRCPECGLDFFWGDLLNPSRRPLAWLYEHAPHWWSARAWLETTVRAALPWHFWRRVELHHRIVPQRLALWLTIAVLSPLAIAVPLSTGAMHIIWIASRWISPRTTSNYTPLSAVSGDTILSLVEKGAEYTITRGGASVTLPIPNDATDASPLGHIRRYHPRPMLLSSEIGPILVTYNRRTWGWSQVYEDELMQTISDGGQDSGFITSSDERDARPAKETHGSENRATTRADGSENTALNFSARRWIGPDGVVMPADLIVVNMTWSPLPPTFTLGESLLGPLGGLIGGDTGLRFAGNGVQPLLAASFNGWPPSVNMLAGPIVYLLAAIAIVSASPSEWRRAHVRTLHLVRIGAYSLLPVLLVSLAIAIILIWSYFGYTLWWFAGAAPSRGWYPTPGGWYTPPQWLVTFGGDDGGVLLTFATMIWAPIYWWSALRQGMRLKRAWALWLFITIGGAVAAFDANLLIDEYAFLLI